MIGRAVRRCMSSGSWSGKMPLCKYEEVLFLLLKRMEIFA